MDDNILDNTDSLDGMFVFNRSDNGTYYLYNSNENTVQEIDFLTKEGTTDNDPPDADNTDLLPIIESIENLDAEIIDLKEDLLSSMDRSNEIIGALLIVLIAHVTLMVFRKIFGMFN